MYRDEACGLHLSRTTQFPVRQSGLDFWTLALVVCYRNLASGEFLDTSSGATKCRSLVAISPRQTARLMVSAREDGSLSPRMSVPMCESRARCCCRTAGNSRALVYERGATCDHKQHRNTCNY
jgi:hypothetical protein